MNRLGISARRTATSRRARPLLAGAVAMLAMALVGLNPASAQAVAGVRVCYSETWMSSGAYSVTMYTVKKGKNCDYGHPEMATIADDAVYKYVASKKRWKNFWMNNRRLSGPVTCEEFGNIFWGINEMRQNGKGRDVCAYFSGTKNLTVSWLWQPEDWQPRLVGFQAQRSKRTPSGTQYRSCHATNIEAMRSFKQEVWGILKADYKYYDYGVEYIYRPYQAPQKVDADC